MKKTLAIGLCSLLLILVLTGCNKKSIVEQDVPVVEVETEADDTNDIEIEDATEEAEEAEEEVVKIEDTDEYEYNLKVGTITALADDEVIYAHADFKTTELRIFGVQGNQLIVWETDVDNSPGPCFRVWNSVNEYKNLFYLDLDEDEKVLEKYLVPEYKVEEAEQEVEKCIEEIQQ